jgi:hypothetical protein
MHFRDKPLGQLRVCEEGHGVHFAHEMPMVIPVAVVVSQHATVIQRATLQVDIREAVGNHVAVFEPDLFFEKRAFP